MTVRGAQKRSTALFGVLVHSLMVALVVTMAQGCIVVYQPMTGLHRPAVIDPTVRNFEDLRLELRCLPGDFLTREQTRGLCKKVRALFETQGAEVSVDESMGYVQDRWDDEPVEDDVILTDLTLELRSFGEKPQVRAKSVALALGTLSLWPVVRETSFRQELVIRDSTGFLLARDSLEGRLITRWGAVSWVGNKALDKLWRSDKEDIGSEQGIEAFSADFYQHLSQQVFNAKMQWQVLQASSVVAGSR